MPRATLNGWDIYYRDAGEGRPVLLIHGLLMDNTMFDAQVEALSGSYRFITPDCRGHGESEKRAEEFTQWDMMEDGVALLDLLEVDRAIWGGVSQGGFQSLRAALKHPDKVQALILIDTQAGPEDPIRSPMYEAFSEICASEGWNDEILTAGTISMFGESASEELKKHWMERWRAQPTHAARQTMRAVSRRDDITDRVREIDVPAVVIHGEEDVAIEMEKAEILAANLGRPANLVKIPRAGHSSTVEQPSLVTAAIHDFLETL